MGTTGLFLSASVDLPVQGTFSATLIVAEKPQAIQHCELMNQTSCSAAIVYPASETIPLWCLFHKFDMHGFF